MRMILLAVGVAAITVAIAAAGPHLWQTYVAPAEPEAAADTEADCDSCSLRHGRLGKEDDGEKAE